jgi:hypothetical protein
MLSVAKQTSYPSLKSQVIKDYKLISCLSAMDPYYTARLTTSKKMIEKRYIVSNHQQVPPDRDYADRYGRPNLQICVPDDIILHTGFIQAIELAANDWLTKNPNESCTIAIPDGLMYASGSLWHCQWNRSGIYCFLDAGHDHAGHVLHFTDSVMWIRAKHFFSIDLNGDFEPADFEMFGHIDPVKLKMICNSRVAQATALGATLDWSRVRCVRAAGGRTRRRR